MKKLSYLIKRVHHAEIHGDESLPVGQVTMDSNQVHPGSCFVALKGNKTDGHSFIADAIGRGAVAIVCEILPDERPDGVCWIRVKDTHLALGQIAAAFYGNPSEDIMVIGVTGTNGKTTIATLLYETFTRLGYRCGLISTIRYSNGFDEFNASHTTPDAVKLQALLSEMVENGCQYCFMEVSSHAVVQKRIAGLTFAGGVFTNLTRDHLDYHPTFADYLKAKQQFFTALPSNAFALTSKDDRNGMVMVQKSRARVVTYGVQSVADFHGRVIENTIDGMQIEYRGQTLWVRLTGMFNAMNLTAVYATATLLQVDNDELLQVMSTLDPVEGRFQQYRGEQGITAVIDYAHTPDALKSVLTTLREVNQDEGMIITVVGAGGDRDTGKRSEMAAIAASLSDKVILTSDNPRSEEPQKILNDMQKGLVGDAVARTITIVDRKEAIKTAVMMAPPNAIILVAGKGHEKYQEIKGVRHHFDDMEIVKSCLNRQM
jgi:UDP-N-acetylmuramoyl-L-alanyl-D-glutamate--2,6-diaminopimelate ligase